MSPKLHRVRVLAATFVVTFLSLAFAQIASADNLLLLDGEKAVINGNLNYGLVYVDGELRITGDTSITAGSIYFGPNANVETCDVEGTGPGTGTNACTQGRSLTLSSPGPVTITGNLDLEAGAGTIRHSGILAVQGSSVAVGGNINTSGNGGGYSGPVTINSAGNLSVGSITAPGATVALNAGASIDVGGDVNTAGAANVGSTDPTVRVANGGPVSINAGGDARVNGNINSSGRDAPAGGLAGGVGGKVTLVGGDVRVGGVDTTGGTSADNAAAYSGDIALTARGSLSVLGRLDASGQPAPKYYATPASTIAATAGGALVVSGGAFATGATGGIGGGSAGGTITLQGLSVDAGPVSVAGGDAPNVAGNNGGAGGTITVAGNARVSIGSMDAGGGDGSNGGGAASGGAISVRSDGGSIATGRVTNIGGNTGGGSGANGGPVSLSAQINLTVGSTLDTSGANATGNANPARVGGNAGRIYLRAATGTVALGGPVRARGGVGAPSSVAGALGGHGGAGARIDVVAHAIGSIVSIFSDGGDGGSNGDTQGPGGPGGSIFSWGDGTLFDDQKVVEANGGDGQGPGAPAARTSEMSPTAVVIDPAKNTLSFTSRSPNAGSYAIVRSLAGQFPTIVGTTTSTGPDRDRRARLRAGDVQRRRQPEPRQLDVGSGADRRLPQAALGDPGLQQGAEVQGEQDGAEVLAQGAAPRCTGT